jgi:peptidoglycan/xylan/chitin deacetylase (PgdA/CDA1 family)
MRNDARQHRRRTATTVALIAVTAVLLTSCASGTARALHLSEGCARGRRVALTFDDGPNPPWTQRILSALSDRHVSATFFLVGDAVEAHPELARAEADAGYEVGAHSWDHASDLDQRQAADFDADVQRMNAAFERALGAQPALYRAPFGHTSETMLERLRAAGYVSVGWDVDSRDWSDDTADQIVASVLDGVHPNAIVLMHDGGRGSGNPDRSQTVAALPRIIDGLRARGYELTTVSALSGVPSEGPVRDAVSCTAR